MADYLFGTLTPSEQAIVFQIFARTVLVGEEKCRLSLNVLTKLSKMNILTVRKAMQSLIGKKIVLVVSSPRPKVAAEYKLRIPEDYPHIHKFQRLPYKMIQDALPSPTPQRVVLTDEGLAFLTTLKRSLSEDADSWANLEVAARQERREGEPLEDAMDRVIVNRYFGPDKKLRFLRPS